MEDIHRKRGRDHYKIEEDDEGMKFVFEPITEDFVAHSIFELA